MTWNLEWDDRARRELRRLDRQVQRNILKYFSDRIAIEEDSRRFGKPLQYKLQGLWCYRIGNYRSVCHIENKQLTVLVLKVAHRSFGELINEPVSS